MDFAINNHKRNFKIDLLRFIGLFLIVLAHVDAPWVVNQFRCFDVPLMVFVSGLCFKPSYGSVIKYLWKRFKRLYIPTFIFLCIFFTFILFIGYLNIRIPYSKAQIIGTFFLMEAPSIGYVWIIRVFILMALISPFLYNFSLKRHYIIIAILIIVFLLQNYLVGVTPIYNNIYLNFFVDEIILYLIGYGIILEVSFLLKKLDNKWKSFLITISLLLLAALIIWEISNKFILPISQLYKYPPRSYYIIYGIIVSIILFLSPLDKIFQKIKKVSKLISFISKHSLWIYLWHIPFVILLNVFLNEDLWALKWIIGISGASMVMAIQILIFESAAKKFNKLNNYRLYLI